MNRKVSRTSPHVAKLAGTIENNPVMAEAAGEAEAVTAVDAIAVKDKCFLRFAQRADHRRKFHSNQIQLNLFIVGIVLKNLETAKLEFKMLNCQTPISKGSGFFYS
jgi:hypothetical protein